MKTNLRNTSVELRRQVDTPTKQRRGDQKPGASAPRHDADNQQLLHQLQVHQIELEMQNVELRGANAQIKASADNPFLKLAEAEISRLKLKLEKQSNQRTKMLRELAMERERFRQHQNHHNNLQQLLVGTRHVLAGAIQDFPEDGRTTLARADQLLSMCIEAAQTVSQKL